MLSSIGITTSRPISIWVRRSSLLRRIAWSRQYMKRGPLITLSLISSIIRLKYYFYSVYFIFFRNIYLFRAFSSILYSSFNYFCLTSRHIECACLWTFFGGSQYAYSQIFYPLGPLWYFTYFTYVSIKSCFSMPFSVS